MTAARGRPPSLPMFDRVISFIKNLPGADGPRLLRMEDDPRVAAAALMFHVINADGVLQTAEQEKLRSTLAEHYSVSGNELESLIEAGEQAERESIDLYAFTRILKQHLAPGIESTKLHVRARAGVAAYRIRVATDGLARELSGMIIAGDWRVKFFPWTIDPGKDLAGWRRLAEGRDAVEVRVPRIEFPFGMGGPRDLKLSDELNRLGPAGNHFGLIGRTSLDLPRGRWRFRTQSDDGVRVLVNGQPLIENWTWHVPAIDEKVFEQTAAGPTEIVVEYFEIDGLATLRLEIEPADAKDKPQ